MSNRYLIMAGGTGGHIFPALAVAKTLAEKDGEIHWLGTANGMEYDIVLSEKIILHIIDIKGFRGKRLLAKCLMPFILLSAIWQAIKVIKKVKPQVIVGFGGYVSAPGGIAARLLGKKLIIHEQNSVAGSTNRLLSKIASRVLEAFPESLSGATWVGNPVRNNIHALFAAQKTVKINEKKNILVMGGSLGAEAMNVILPDAIKLLAENIQPNIWHQTGKNKLDPVVNFYQELGIAAKLVEFIGNVEAAYEWADIIICRAGALTISEVSIVGLPAIFVPYPYAIDDHQRTNAKWLVDQDAAFMINQSELTAESLKAVLEKMLTDDALLESMSKKLKEVAVPDATEKVAAICEKACLESISHAA